jgi:hypothetical protein
VGSFRVDRFADVLLKSRRSLGYVGFAQLDWELVQGLHGLVTGFEARIDAVVRQQDEFQLWAMLHVYL